MVLGYSNEEIVRKAVESQSSMTDGVVQYDYEDNKLFGAGFTTGTTENPENPFIEVFRLRQGEDGRIDCRCWESGDCPYWDDDIGVFGGFDEDKIVDGRDCEDCCLEAYADDGFEEDWECNFKDGVEEQIRDVLSEHLSDAISKLNDIRIALSDRFEPWRYIDVRQDDWELRVLDYYVDAALEDGFTLDVSPRDWLDGDIENICLTLEEDRDFSDFVRVLRDGDFDGALKLLQ